MYCCNDFRIVLVRNIDCGEPCNQYSKPKAAKYTSFTLARSLPYHHGNKHY